MSKSKTPMMDEAVAYAMRVKAARKAVRDIVRSNTPTTMSYTLNTRELGTVLAALRSYKEAGYGDMTKLPLRLSDIAVDGLCNRTPLDDNEIDALCERLNACKPTRNPA